MNSPKDGRGDFSQEMGLRVTRITPSQAQPGKVWVRVAGEKLLLDIEEASTFGLQKGTELSEGLFDALSEKSRSNTAYFKALNCLARQEYSQKGLCRKLREKGVDEEAAREAAEKATEKGYVDDSGYAKRLASSLSGYKSLGVRQVKSRLIQKGISGEDLTEALETLPPPGEGLERLLNRKFSGRTLEDKKDRERAARFLLSKGYEWEDVKRALDAFAGENEDDYGY